MGHKKVVIYTSNHCPYCRSAKELLKSKGVVFEEVDVTDAPEKRAQLVEKAEGRTTVPQIFIDDKSIGGYQDLVEFYESGQVI